MEKVLIITGNSKVHKIDYASSVIAGYQNHEIASFRKGELVIDDVFSFHKCTKSTKIITLSEFDGTQNKEIFYGIVSGKFEIRKPHWNAFLIEIDKLIIICDEKLTKANFPTDASFTRRFEIVEL